MDSLSKLDKWYDRIGDPDAQTHLTNISTFDPQVWSKWFQKYSERHDTSSIRAMRKLIWYGTEKYSNQRRYHLLDGSEVVLCDNKSVIAEQAKATKFLDFTRDFNMDLPAELVDMNYDTVVEVVEGDCLEEGIRLKRELGLNPAVLNMASAKRAGGGYLNGAGAQEENLFRRTNYFHSLEDPDQLDSARSWYYPLPEFSGVYSPSVFVFRESEQRGYGLMAEPLVMSFIAVAAYASPKLNENRKRPPYLGTYVLADNFIEKTKRKMRVMLFIALSHGHDSMVLSAFGCGAYKNPPGHIAQLFREVLNEPKFKNKFKHISFAIFNDHNANKQHNPLGNYFPFAEVFKDMSAKHKKSAATNAKNVATKNNNAKNDTNNTNTNNKNNTNSNNNDKSSGAANTTSGAAPSNTNSTDEKSAVNMNTDVSTSASSGSRGGWGRGGSTSVQYSNRATTHHSNTEHKAAQLGTTESRGRTHSNNNAEQVHTGVEAMEIDERVINFYRTNEVPYGVFSNFARYPIKLNNKVWPTTEHYFQAMKFVGTPHEEELRQCKQPGDVAKMGRERSRPLRADWNEVKEQVMEEALMAKFTQHPQLKKVLLDTKDAVLVEHTKNDSYWADGGDGTGLNRLGALLMVVRTKLREEAANKAKK